MARDPHWLDEAYTSAIASTDTGLVMRNNSIGRKLASVLFGVLSERGTGRYADMAGGYGMLTRVMRDYGFDFYWVDKYCSNLMARGFEYDSKIGPCIAVTAIEIMEHLEDPLEFVREAFKITNSDVFIFTTEIFEGSPPPLNWWYYSFETGQHIAFYKIKTLEMMAGKLGLYFVSAGGIHIFSKHKINLNMLKLATSRLSILIVWLLRKVLSTKVMQDHYAMVNYINNKK